MHMDRAIFEIKASVEATSLYILLCALKDQGESITLDRASIQWHGSRESLRQAAQELIQRGVLLGSIPVVDDQPLAIQPSTEWLWSLSGCPCCS